MKGNFNSIIQSRVPVLVDFSAGKLKVIKIDVDKNTELAARYQIRGVPTLALFKEGNLLWRQSGLVDKANLTSILQNYL